MCFICLCAGARFCFCTLLFVASCMYIYIKFISNEQDFSLQRMPLAESHWFDIFVAIIVVFVLVVVAAAAICYECLSPSFSHL